jgi:Uma2 family endonuclease
MPSTAPNRIGSVDEFLHWEEQQHERFEFVGGVVRLMAGGTEAHDRIAVKLILALGSRLRGTPCSVHGSNLKVVSRSAGAVMYPDVFVRCGERGSRRTVIDDPLVVFEVLSEGTARHDLIRKRIACEAIPSLRRIVYVAADEARVDMRVRDGAGHWLDENVQGLGAALALPELGIEVPLAEIYEESEVAEPRPLPRPDEVA